MCGKAGKVIFMDSINEYSSVMSNLYTLNTLNNQPVKTASNINSTNKFERTPEKDTISFSGSNNNSEKVLDELDIDVRNGFLGMGKRTIKGKILNKQIDLKLDTGTFTDDVKLIGTINGKPVKLKLKDYKLTGTLADEDRDLIPYLKMFMSDKRTYDNNLEMMVIAI